MIAFSGVTDFSFGWRHYSKRSFVRGCVEEDARECVRIWVRTELTTNVSVTCEWSLADGEGTAFLANQERVHFKIRKFAQHRNFKVYKQKSFFGCKNVFFLHDY